MDKIMRLDREHWFWITVILGAFAFHVEGLEDWRQLLEPKHFGAMLGAIVASLRLAFKPAPGGGE